MAIRVVVIGGGISGLSAAYDLTRAGIDCTILEKQTRVGGVIETRVTDGCTLESGPDSFLSAKPAALALTAPRPTHSQASRANPALADMKDRIQLNTATASQLLLRNGVARSIAAAML